VYVPEELQHRQADARIEARDRSRIRCFLLG
jgi:hypothetical protein